MEEGTAIVAVLQVAGKEDVPLGVRTWEQIRWVVHPLSRFPHYISGD